VVAQLDVDTLQEGVLGNNSIDFVQYFGQEGAGSLADQLQNTVDGFVSVAVNISHVTVVVQVLEIGVRQVNDVEVNLVVLLDGELKFEVKLCYV